MKFLKHRSFNFVITNFRSYLFIILLFTTFPGIGQTGTYVPELALFDSKMQALITKYQLAGGQLAITYQGRLVYSRGFGYADTTDKSLVQPQSIFRIASASKSITALTVMKLYEQGRLNLDSKVLGTSGVLNDTQYSNAIDPRMYQFTVRQLLNHSAGFNYAFANEPLWQSYNIAVAMGVTPPTNSFAVVLKWTLLNKSLSFAPGTSAGYSNFGYTLLGLVIEKVTGMKYEKYVRDSILKPLGINEMYAGKSLKQNKLPNEVSYYDYPGAPLSTSTFTGIPNSVPAQYGGYHWELITPAGGWVASAQELCKLLVCIDKLNNKPDMLKPNTIDTMMLKSTQWPDYALGWFVTPEEYYHTGGIQGTASVIRYNRTKQVSYAIIFNALPQNYTPMYNEFMALVSNEFAAIATWPTHDLFVQPNGMSNKPVFDETIITSNPNTNKITIGKLSENFFVKAVIYNLHGIEISQNVLTNENAVIDIEPLPSGIYFIILKEENGRTMVKKFLKM